MVLSIGKSAFLPEDEVIAIFDLETTSQSYLTREFLAAAEKQGLVENAAEDLPNSFLLCEAPDRSRGGAGSAGEAPFPGTRVLLSQSMSRTLARRMEGGQ